MLADAARGIDRNAEKRAAAAAISGAITLRQALALYGNELRDNQKAAPSIRTVEYDVPRLLAKEMDRPLAELTVEAVQRIKERGRAHKMQTNRLLAHISAIWNTTLRLHARGQPWLLIGCGSRFCGQQRKLSTDPTLRRGAASSSFTARPSRFSLLSS